mmetsp:Transcript_9726/g.20147  ORF Transcript_9726/g.20147 Transcript_9726/m.20147 type:complete len:107 (-) Transcript_9726:1251-1571(-)
MDCEQLHSSTRTSLLENQTAYIQQQPKTELGIDRSNVVEYSTLVNVSCLYKETWREIEILNSSSILMWLWLMTLTKIFEHNDAPTDCCIQTFNPFVHWYMNCFQMC